MPAARKLLNGLIITDTRSTLEDQSELRLFIPRLRPTPLGMGLPSPADLLHFGATKSAQDISAQHNLRRSESAQVKIGAGQKKKIRVRS